jgi:putative ABC transport system permease protein
VIERLAARAFRLLLAGYPRAFRQAYSDDMQALFAERYAEARNARRTAAFLARTFINLITTACAEYIAAWRTAHTSRRHSATRRLTMAGVIQDLSYACRLLRRRPAFTLFVVLTLALGIGANTAVFTVVNGVLLRPLPYPESERLVNVWGRFDPESGFDFPQFAISGPEYLDYRDQNTTLEDVAAFTGRSLTVGGPGADPERVQGVAITANLLRILRTTPALGRAFSSDEMKADAPSAVLLSRGYWQTRFGADPNIVGRIVPVNGVPATIVGVMPASFAFPLPDVRMWTPLRIDPANPGGRSSHRIRSAGVSGSRVRKRPTRG